MEVRPGYKQTEVGVIPEEWKVVQIDDLQPVVTSGSRGWARYYSEHGSLFVRITNLSRETIYLNLDDVRLVKLPAESYEGTRTQLKVGDVLISITADIGIVGYVDSRVPTPAFINQHIALVRFDPSTASGRFVSYFLASDKSQRLFRASTDVGAKAGMSLLTVQKLQLALPPLPEQRAIAEALSNVDALLGAEDAALAKKGELKQATMQQLLTGQTRLPGFQDGWEVKSLGLVGRCFAGGTPSTARPEYWGGEIIWLPSGRVQNSILSAPTDSEIRITKRGLDESAAKKIEANSVLMAVTGATCANVGLLHFEAAANQSVVAIEPDTETDHRFLFYALLMERGQILARQGGSAQGGVNLRTVKGIEVRFPRLPEQTAISEVLSDMDAEIAALEARRDKTRALKQAMMQELVTGRTRLV